MPQPSGVADEEVSSISRLGSHDPLPEIQASLDIARGLYIATTDCECVDIERKIIKCMCI